MNEKFLGVVPDIREDIEKNRDYTHDEVASALPFIWQEKPKEAWRSFKARNQDGSSSCMAQSGAKVLGVENFLEENNFIELSATPIYQARYNKPAGGMWLQDLLSILSKPNACLESQVPSQNMSESQINASYEKTQAQADIAELYRAGGYIQFTSMNIDDIASVVAQGKAVVLVTYFKAEEWWGNQTVNVKEENLDFYKALHHGIACVDTTLIDGKKCLIIEDSATLPGENHQRVLTEDFFNKRVYGAGYLIDLKNDKNIKLPKPNYKFTRIIPYGETSIDVKNLQDFLKWSGDFPTGIESTGFFGNITAQSLVKFQVRNSITDFANEKDYTKVRVGVKTLALLATYKQN